MKYFFIDGGDRVHSKNDILDMIHDGDIENGTILYDQKRDIGGEMCCKYWDEFVEKGDTCGQGCKQYNPCNGISGRCVQLVNGFIHTGNKSIVLDGKIKMLEKE